MSGAPHGDYHTAIGDMTRDAWRRGRRTGFWEGALVGALVAFGIVLVRFFT